MRPTALRSVMLGLLLPAASLVIACGGSDSSQFVNGNAGDGGPIGPDNPATSLGQIGGPHPTDSACVSATANAALTPVDMVVMYDRSGSMGDKTEGFDPTVKWIPVNTAMKAFFTDPSSVGISASLQFFPEGGDLASVCAYDYATPKVAMTPLASSQPIIAALDATQPNGGTPTLPALTGAVNYAKLVASQLPNDKVVVVLVTDGDPGFGVNGQLVTGCTNNDIPHVAAEAQAAAAANPSIKTYVIGVGLDVQNLDAIASAGGTQKAIMVPVNDPAQTSAAFQAALNQIRTQTFSCDFALPPPPAGKSIDKNAVNVVFSHGGTDTVLSYSADCSNANGWHYDNAAAPTKIELCSSVCGTAQGDRSSKLTLAFGCQTVGVIK